MERMHLSGIALAIIVAICRVEAEVYTAIVDMEPLLETHKRILDDLEAYIQKEEKRLDFLKRQLTIYKDEHQLAMDDIPNYLGNPINAFTLIKRLTKDLDRIENIIQIGTEYIKNVTMTQKDVKYPTGEDLNGAAEALIRLQDTYHLDVAQLAEGKLNGVLYSHPLTASDCFELGRSLYSLNDYHYARLWMQEALRKVDDGDNELQSFTRADILEYIAFSYYLQDDIEEALVWTQRLVALAPDHPRAAANIPHYKKAIDDNNRAQSARLRGETSDQPEEPPRAPVKRRASLNTHERSVYESLCRGDMSIPARVAHRLKCRYLNENHPFLKLAPFKVEEMYLEPNIYLFHQVMSDQEIERIKDMARPRFQRATVHNPETGELVPAHYRISKSAWLKDQEARNVGVISQRVSDMTGLAMASAEELQVVNYGIGGHYEPHFDFARKEEKHAFQDMEGNRIATVLFYMSEVAQGGATVFTELGLSLAPVKGAAVFWMNLHPSGEGDYSTRHAACPVLRGSKWVSNKWIHQGGQELVKPCGLEYQREGIARPLPAPVPKSSR